MTILVIKYGYMFRLFFLSHPQANVVTEFRYIKCAPNGIPLLTYLITPWSRVLLEKLTGSVASQEILRIF